MAHDTPMQRIAINIYLASPLRQPPSLSQKTRRGRANKKCQVASYDVASRLRGPRRTNTVLKIERIVGRLAAPKTATLPRSRLERIDARLCDSLLSSVR